MKAVQTMSNKNNTSLAQAMGRTVATELGHSSEEPTNGKKSLAESLFSQSGAKLPSADLIGEQDELKETEERKRLEQEAHARVNPVDTKEVFARRELADKEEIEGLIASLFQMAQTKQIPKIQTPEILDARVVKAGERGNVFQGLLAQAQNLIETHKPQDWATAMSHKKAKGPQGPGAKTKEVKHRLENPEVNVVQGA